MRIRLVEEIGQHFARLEKRRTMRIRLVEEIQVIT